MRTNHKPFLTFDEQCAKIASYGMIIEDQASCIGALKRLGYYRLSGYWYPFRQISSENETPSSLVNPGITFDDVVGICDFDERVRRVLLDGLAIIETGVRVAIAYRLGQFGAMGYMTPQAWGDHCIERPLPTEQNLEPATPFEEFCRKHNEMIARSQEDFVVHFAERYAGEVPVWAAIELWDFGTMSRAFRMLKSQDKKQVASDFGVSSKVFASWLVGLNDLRNFCAHHNRLCRRVFVKKPVIPRSSELPEFTHIPIPEPGEKIRLYPLLCVMSYLVLRIHPEDGWQKRIVVLFQEIEELHLASLENYGIPETWINERLWADPR